MEEKVSKKKSNKGIVNSMAMFYKAELKNKHKWNFVIGLFIYFAMLIALKTGAISLEKINQMLTSNVDVYNSETSIYEVQVVNSSTNAEAKPFTRVDAMKQQIALSFVTVISGLTPFINIPTLVTLVYPITYAYSIYTYGIVEILLMSIMAIIEIFLITLLVAVGMYWCKMATRHFRYNESSSFSLNDVRLQFNEAMKKNEKVEEIKKKMDEKYEKMKKLNEKTNYIAIIEFGILATSLLLICTLITGV